MNTTTEALPIIQPAHQPIILTKQCRGGWIACLADEPGKWEYGLNETEAIGKLHRMNQDILGTIHRQEQ